MRILVTGAAGMLGGALVAHLRAIGHHVRTHDRVPTAPSESAYTATVGDLSDISDIGSLVAGVDAVVHAAAIPAPVDDTVFDNNVSSAYRLLEAAGREGVGRIVYISSLSAVGLAWSARGAAPQRLPLTEDHPWVGDDPYGLSKHVGELITATVANRTGIPAVSLRLPFVGTGARLAHHLDHVATDLAAHRADLWSWLDTRDAAGAVAAALTAAVTGHHVVNVAAPDTAATVPTRELLARYHPEIDVAEPLEGYAVPVSTHRCRELLGFVPAHAWRTS